MLFPEKIPGLRLLAAIGFIYGLVWIGLEGALWRVVVLGVGAAFFIGGAWMQRRWGERYFTPRQWLARTAVVGILLGAGSGLLTLLFMTLKTGLHAHGPEFSQAEIAWLVSRLPLWALAGGLGGLGLGLLVLGLRKER